MGWHRSGSHSFHELLFWKLIFVCQSVKWHYCLKKGGSGAGKLEDFLQGPINGKETSEELCSYGWILPRPLLVSCRCGHLWDRPAAACWWCLPQPTPRKNLIGNKTPSWLTQNWFTSLFLFCAWNAGRNSTVRVVWYCHSGKKKMFSVIKKTVS